MHHNHYPAACTKMPFHTWVSFAGKRGLKSQYILKQETKGCYCLSFDMILLLQVRVTLEN